MQKKWPPNDHPFEAKALDALQRRFEAAGLFIPGTVATFTVNQYAVFGENPLPVRDFRAAWQAVRNQVVPATPRVAGGRVSCPVVPIARVSLWVPLDFDPLLAEEHAQREALATQPPLDS